MSLIRRTWQAVQGDPVFMRRVNGWLTLFWIVMIPVSIATQWVSSVTYVAALSLWALVSGHWSAWQAARVEVEQQRELEERQEEDIPGEIVERIVRETVVDRLGSSPAVDRGGVNPDAATLAEGHRPLTR